MGQYQLLLGLYAEGRTDERFLPIIIRRASEVILANHDRTNIEAMEPMVIQKPSNISSLDKRILNAAREACSYHILVVHSDEDGYGYKQTRRDRFVPGYNLVKQNEEQDVCKDLAPIIPVRMVEAWMLADPDALRSIMRTKLSVRALGLPGRAVQVESDKDPKETLKQVIQKAYPTQSRYWNRIRGELYEKLAPVISLERLNQVPSYKQFVHDLTFTLKSLKLIQ